MQCECFGPAQLRGGLANPAATAQLWVQSSQRSEKSLFLPVPAPHVTDLTVHMESLSEGWMGGWMDGRMEG